MRAHTHTLMHANLHTHTHTQAMHCCRRNHSWAHHTHLSLPGTLAGVDVCSPPPSMLTRAHVSMSPCRTRPAHTSLRAHMSHWPLRTPMPPYAHMCRPRWRSLTRMRMCGCPCPCMLTWPSAWTSSWCAALEALG